MRQMLFLLCCWLICNPLIAQPEHPCAKAHAASAKPHMKTTVLSPLENLYDVKWVKLDLQLDNMSTSVAGSATTLAFANAPMGKYCFELNKELTIDSVKVNGVAVSVTTQTNGLRTVTLPTPLTTGNSLTATGWYRGTLNATSNLYSWFDYGLLNYTDNGHHLTVTNSSFMNASDWWPAKQSLTDKIDSVDLHFTVPDSCQAASNGLLRSVVNLGGGRKRYEWKSNYPID